MTKSGCGVISSIYLSAGWVNTAERYSTLPHSSGCLQCARGEGPPLWVLTGGYPGGKTRPVSLRPDQVPQVRKALANYRSFQRSLEAISEWNPFLLRLDREESQEPEHQP